ncbi:uncharacterized protein N0V89_005472 [Didymosphaeria variabile]|uniref:DUF1308 domain-containing protein n=1 Tax=Didymosphaeria variabile TaxID=1932322 RepID=A0A9W8XKU2_9PLEO|nr:uncharacterized protein N0V89_005472 [Didymosphaeria variabile]KAJ4353742.1 hypothetical protein N0V89_005472 [Didymosphaeria variabile]
MFEAEPEPTLGTENQGPLDHELTQRISALRDEFAKYLAGAHARHADLSAVLERPPAEYDTIQNVANQRLAAYNKHVSASNKSRRKQKPGPKLDNLAPDVAQLENFWKVAKLSSGILAFQKLFFWDRSSMLQYKTRGGLSHFGKWARKGALMTGINQNSFSKHFDHAIKVDIVAQDGLEWVRVCSATEKKLLFDLAKLGWQNDSDSDVEEGSDNCNSVARASNITNITNGDDALEILRDAHKLARAAKANPIRGQTPRIRFVMTRVASGRVKEIDAILDKIRATGAILQCVDELPEAVDLDVELPRMLPGPIPSISQVLNVDYTILRGLVSDISHCECTLQDDQVRQVRESIEIEMAEKFLPAVFYPTVASYPMVCTTDTVEQLYQILDLRGSSTEQQRADVLFARGSHANAKAEDLIDEWRKLSIHAAPDHLHLPIRVVSSQLDENLAKLPAMAKKMVDLELYYYSPATKSSAPATRSSFLYGWAHRLTTLTGNGAVSKYQMSDRLDQGGLGDGEEGPHFWLLAQMTRVLYGRPRHMWTVPDEENKVGTEALQTGEAGSS